MIGIIKLLFNNLLPDGTCDFNIYVTMQLPEDK